MDEFQIISRYFDRGTISRDVQVGIGDDAAVVNGDARAQVHALDTLVEDVHFPADMAPDAIAWRLVAVNLSDLAAMGATPRWMTLALTLRESDPAWLDRFADGLFAAATRFGVELIGGDTSRGPAVVLSASVTGVLAQGSQPLLRSGANEGDGIYVSGTLGDAAAGLALYNDKAPNDVLVERFLRPTPRLDLVPELAGVATAAIDVSDGLAGDLGKLLNASGRGGEIDIGKIPLSPDMQAEFDIATCRDFALAGGDDYELCFTAPAGTAMKGSTCIGAVTGGTGLKCLLDGDSAAVRSDGYRHFG